jgi:hypothetical protein
MRELFGHIANVANAEHAQVWYDSGMTKGKPGKKVGRAADSGRFTIGQDRFAKISAVEGIVLTKKMRARIAEFDNKGMSAEERRRTIIRAHRKG